MSGIVQNLKNTSGSNPHTSVGQGSWASTPMGPMSIEAYLDAVGGTATIEVHGSNIGAGVTPSAGTLMVTFTMSGVNDRASITKPSAMYKFMCVNITAIAGGATARIVIGG